MPPPARNQENRKALGENNPHHSAGVSPHLPHITEPEEGEFIPVARNGKGRKDKGKTAPPQINLSPTSYATAASAAVNTQQPKLQIKPPSQLPAITEVTVIRSGNGGHTDPEIELSIRLRAADAIVREVRLKMGSTVSNPIPLRAGRWSAHPRSKGNFVYSFDGNISFELIQSYERILLAPFYGTGKLSPSMGWTRLLAHGVPVSDENWFITGPDALLKEVKTMPGLKKAHFAMPPRWLKPVDRIDSDYSTITFAISDPDGSITNRLLSGRAALFGKEVEIQRWVEKPALVQCSHCHVLGHIKTSRACPLGKDSVRCYICGGSHRSETHDQNCRRNHAIAGICDCKHFKCINCHKTGHHSRDPRCPARDLFRPRTNRRQKKSKTKGKERERYPDEEPNPAPPYGIDEDLLDDDEDLYAPTRPLRSAPSRQQKTAQHHAGVDNICDKLYGPSTRPLEDENGANSSSTRPEYDLNIYPDALNGVEPMNTDSPPSRATDYSPSRPQGGAANENLA